MALSFELLDASGADAPVQDGANFKMELIIKAGVVGMPTTKPYTDFNPVFREIVEWPIALTGAQAKANIDAQAAALVAARYPNT